MKLKRSKFAPIGDYWKLNFQEIIVGGNLLGFLKYIGLQRWKSEKLKSVILGNSKVISKLY